MLRMKKTSLNFYKGLELNRNTIPMNIHMHMHHSVLTHFSVCEFVHLSDDVIVFAYAS